MKKVYSIFFLLAVVVVLVAGCGSGGGGSQDVNQNEPVNLGQDQADPVPAVVSIYPLEATAVPINATLQVTFDRDMKTDTFNGNFILLDALDNQVPGVITYNSGTKTAVFAPANPLSYETTYVATLKAQISDMLGNLLGVDFTFSFITSPASDTDTTPPYVTSIAPYDGEVGVSINSPVEIAFSEPVDLSNISDVNISVAGVTGSFEVVDIFTAKFNPSTPLSYSTTYAVTVNGIKDMAGNVMAQPFTSSFKTVAAPVATSLGKPIATSSTKSYVWKSKTPFDITYSVEAPASCEYEVTVGMSKTNFLKSGTLKKTTYTGSVSTTFTTDASALSVVDLLGTGDFYLYVQANPKNNCTGVGGNSDFINFTITN